MDCEYLPLCYFRLWRQGRWSHGQVDGDVQKVVIVRVGKDAAIHVSLMLYITFYLLAYLYPYADDLLHHRYTVN